MLAVVNMRRKGVEYKVQGRVPVARVSGVAYFYSSDLFFFFFDEDSPSDALPALAAFSAFFASFRAFRSASVSMPS